MVEDGLTDALLDGLLEGLVSSRWSNRFSSLLPGRDAGALGPATEDMSK